MAKKKEKEQSSLRTRNWTCLVYPESCAENWIEILQEQHVAFVVSPLHNKDIDEGAELKKPHYHVLFLFEGVKTYSQVEQITKKIKATIPQRVHGVRALVRYFAHLDNPDKYQYNVKDIVGYGGADVTLLMKPTSSERYYLIKEMMEFCINNNIVEMEDLLVYSMQERFDDWFVCLCDNSAYIISALLKSRRHRGVSLKVNIETGELR
jgi:hypothetical protein